MAVGQPVHQVTDTPLSGASPLPHLIRSSLEEFIPGMKKPAATAGFSYKQVTDLR